MWIAAVLALASPQQIVAAQRHAQLPEPPGLDFAGGPDFAYGLLPPEFVLGPEIEDAQWSPTGRSIFIQTKETNVSPEVASAAMTGELTPENQPSTTHRLLGWSFEKRKLNVLYTLPETEVAEQARWLPKSDSIVVSTASESPQGGIVTSFGILNAESGQVKPLMTSDEKASILVDVSPVRPLGALVRLRRTPSATGQGRPDLNSTIRFFSIDGRLGPVIDLPTNYTLRWDETTGLPLGATWTIDPATKKAAGQYFSIDPSTGKLTPSGKPASVNAPPSQLDVASKEVKIKDGSLQAKAGTIWLECRDGKPEEAGVVTTDGKNGVVSPQNNGVLYVSKAGLFVRRMFKFSRLAYDDHLKRVAKQKAMDDAKQVALAILMYSNDYDDKLPANDGNWRNNIDPYLKDGDMAGGFTYVFGGGLTTDIENPATTILGYVNGPDGRAIAFTDGHVVWQPNP